MFCAAAGAPVGGLLVDFLRHRLSFEISMKIAHTLGMWVPIMNLLIVALAHQHLSFAVVVILLSTMYLFAPFYR